GRSILTIDRWSTETSLRRVLTSSFGNCGSPSARINASASSDELINAARSGAAAPDAIGRVPYTTIECSQYCAPMLLQAVLRDALARLSSCFFRGASTARPRSRMHEPAGSVRRRAGSSAEDGASRAAYRIEGTDARPR